MGNTPSVEEPPEVPRRPVKLSKPRTGSHASASLLSPNGFSSSTLRFSNSRLSAPLPSRPVSPAPSPTTASLPPPGPSQSEPTVGSQPAGPTAQRDGRRRSLFRSNSSQDSPSQRDRRSSSIGAAVSRAGDKLGRRNSMTYESAINAFYSGRVIENRPTAGSRTSWSYDMKSYEAKRLLITEEHTIEQSIITSEKITVVSDGTWKGSNPGQSASQPGSTPISRANSDLSMYTPVRRRSIIRTPGVATRTRSSPAPPPSFRFSHPPTPSLSRQQSFESETGRVLSMPPRIAVQDSIPRVATPCESDYQSLGAFKLGSLRIANGTASPVSPEVDRTRRSGARSPCENRAGRGDYFSRARVSEKETSGEGDQADVALPEASHESPVAELPGASISPMDGSSEGSSADVSVDYSPARIPESSPEYLPEIQLSPFSLEGPVPISPLLQTTSKHTAVEDQLFEDEGAAEYSSHEVLDVRLDPNAKSEPTDRLDPSRKSIGSVARTDSGVVASPASEYPHRPLAKADSGYSSNVSLRSFHSTKAAPSKDVARSSFETRRQESKRRQSATNGELQLQGPETVTINDKPPKSPEYHSPPPVPPKDFPSAPLAGSRNDAQVIRGGSPGGNDHGYRRSLPSISRKPLQTPSPINISKAVDRAPKSPDSIPLSPLSVKSEGSTSALSIGSGSNKPSKLQRLLSSSRRPSNGPPAVHAIHELDITAIPSVPHEVEAKLHEHTGMFPMTTKRLALKTQASKDTLRTIFSVGSLEISKDDLLPPLPPLPHDVGGVVPGGLEIQRNLTPPAAPSTIASSTAFLIPRKPIARKPVSSFARKDPEGRDAEKTDRDGDNIPLREAELTTYSSINNTLGKNAYDAAFTVVLDSGSTRVAPTGRAMSMTIQLERNLELGMGSPRALDRLSPPSLPSPVMIRELVLPKKARTPPPVSMKTRRPSYLRVPPPLRPRSTPVGPSARDPLRRTSREGVHDYPPYQQTGPAAEETISSSPPPIPPMSPRRSMELWRPSAPGPTQHPRRQTRTPNWEVQTDHDVPRRLSADFRTNSLTSGPYWAGIQRPASAQAFARQPNPPPLRHRSSYDGFSNTHGYGPLAPRMTVGDGGATIQDGQPNYPYDPTAAQWDSYGRYPPYVPRRPYRNSMGAGRPEPSGQAPYRVLHSYNSPAYRNVPIWG